jgi:hypothetical protein
MSHVSLVIHCVICLDSQCLMTYLQPKEAVVRVALNVVKCHLDFVGLSDGSERDLACTLSRSVFTDLSHVYLCRCSVFLRSLFLPACLSLSLSLSFFSLSIWNYCTFKTLSDVGIVYLRRLWSCASSGKFAGADYLPAFIMLCLFVIEVFYCIVPMFFQFLYLGSAHHMTYTIISQWWHI